LRILALGLDYPATRSGHSQQSISAEAQVIRRAIQNGAATSIDIFSAEDLSLLSPALAKLANLPLIPTEAAKLTERIVEGRGMVILGATSVTVNGQ